MTTKEEVTKNIMIDHMIKNIKKMVADKSSRYTFQDIEENSSKLFSDYYNKLLEEYGEVFKLNIISGSSDIEKTRDLEWIDHEDYAIAYDPINKTCLMKIKEEEKMEKKELMNAKDLVSLCMIYPNISINTEKVKEEVNRVINSDEMYNAITGAMQNDETCVKFDIRYSFKLFYRKLKYSDNLYRLFKNTMIQKMKEKGFSVENFQFEPNKFSFLVDWKQAMTEKICEDDKVEE